MNDENCITIDKKGHKEKRVYESSGTFLIYGYKSEEGVTAEKKLKILLRNKGGKIREFFIIPMKDNKYLVFESEEKGERGILKDGTCVSISDLL